ncbi:MAG: hypothetical protein LBT12_08050 [Oscillospiraceae bacterium]|nr:hypothetical protein [Oscillospiraceae bacterium]
MNKINEFKEIRMSKKGMAITAALITAALLLTGTFAWQQMVSKTNEFIGSNETPTLHDDFDPSANLKDIYVENTAKRALFIRVKLEEAMNLTDNTWRPAANGYLAHTFETAVGDCEHENAEGERFHNYFTWTMGGQKWFMPSATPGGISQDTNSYDGTTPGARQTPPVAFLKMADYILLGDPDRDAFNGWVYDTDGYAYWSQPLLEDEVTGLLLHGVATDNVLKDTNYYYAINVVLQSVDKADLPMWRTGAASVDGSGTVYDKATNDAQNFLTWLEARLAILQP